METKSIQFIKAMVLGAVFSVFTLSGTAFGADINVKITNVSHGSFFTPLLITAHGGNSHLFELGESASASLQAMAEGGDISGLSTMMGGADADTIENPAGGLMAPGDTAMADLNTDASGNTYLSLVAMILPTNDGFVGMDALKIPTAKGTYAYMLNAYDSGTEGNNELAAADGGIPGTAGFPNPPPVGSTDFGGSGVAGMDANAKVQIHRGILGDTNPSGGMSDIDSTKYRWLNPIARLVITVN